MATIIVNPFYVSGGGGGGSTLLTGLVSWWDLTTNGNDAHGSNNLSNRGTPSFGTVGGYASVTTSNTNTLYIAAPSGLDLDTLTMAVWYYDTGSSAGAVMGGVYDGTAAATIRFRIAVTPSQVRAAVSDGSTLQSITVTATKSTSTWQLAILTYDQTTGDGYVYMNDGGGLNNGYLATGFSTLNSASFGMGIGGDGDGTGSGSEWTGALKSAAVWSRVLSSDERAELYNSGTPLVYADL